MGILSNGRLLNDSRFQFFCTVTEKQIPTAQAIGEIRSSGFSLPQGFIQLVFLYQAVEKLMRLTIQRYRS
jgi:protein tyrosine phosphatase